MVFGSWRAVDVTAEAIDRYITDAREVGFSPATINRGTQLLAQAFKLAIERKRVSSAPLIRHLPERNARHGFFDDADFRALVEALPDYLHDFTRFGYITGWRKGEIASLLWVEVEGDVIRLRAENSKNNQGRSIPLRDSQGRLTEVGELIENRRRLRKFESDQGPVFASRVFPSRWATDLFRDMANRSDTWISSISSGSSMFVSLLDRRFLSLIVPSPSVTIPLKSRSRVWFQ